MYIHVYAFILLVEYGDYSQHDRAALRSDYAYKYNDYYDQNRGSLDYRDNLVDSGRSPYYYDNQDIDYGMRRPVDPKSGYPPPEPPKPKVKYVPVVVKKKKKKRKALQFYIRVTSYVCLIYILVILYL